MSHPKPQKHPEKSKKREIHIIEHERHMQDQCDFNNAAQSGVSSNYSNVRDSSNYSNVHDSSNYSNVYVPSNLNLYEASKNMSLSEMLYLLR